MSSRFLGLLVAVAALGTWTCGNSGSMGGSSGTGASSGAGHSGLLGAAAATGTGSGAATGTGAGASTGTGTGGVTGTAGAAASGTGTGGVSTAAGCMPGVSGLQLTDCGYPTGTTGLASVVFNESTVLEAVVPSGGEPTATIAVFYNDEHAMTLGVRQVVLKDAAGTTMMDFPVSALPSDPGTVSNPQLGTTTITGDYSGLDVSLRPMWPALFITDTTSNPNSRTGDWQSGGVPVGPTAVFGSWKAAVRTVDNTVNPPAATVTPDPDPMPNNWNLGPGADPVPASIMGMGTNGGGTCYGGRRGGQTCMTGGTGTSGNLGFGAEARFVVSLKNGHSYRLQVMVHDGDQLKVGGDSGEACILYCAGTSTGGGTGGTGGSAPPPMCPAGVTACTSGGVEGAVCPTGYTCLSGCCVSSTIIP
jgi:hypothetical protein